MSNLVKERVAPDTLKTNGKRRVFRLLLEVLGLSLVTIFVQVMAQNGFDWSAYIGYITSPMILVFNLLPVYLIILIGCFVFNRHWMGFLLANIPLSAGLIISEYKIYFRDDPFKPIDLMLYGESFSILKNYQLVPMMNLILFAVLVLIAFAIVIKKGSINAFSAMTRTIGCITGIFLLFLSYSLVYSNDNIYKKVPSKANIYYDVDLYARKGFVFSFLSGISTTKYPKPESYSSEACNSMLYDAGPVLEQPLSMPNVIAVMSEAFFDIRSGNNVEIYEGMDPLPNYTKMMEDAYYGNLVVPGFGGSTVSTEFEFLTGTNLSLISEAQPVAYKSYINKDIYGLPRFFKDHGYAAHAIHPGHSWFYNRSNVYKYMGFDDFLTAADLPDDVDRVNHYISDDVTSGLIIDSYSRHLDRDPDAGYFGFTVTIQNHGPYMDYDTEKEKRYVRPEGISDEHYHIINNYMDGLYDADRLIGNVREYLECLDVPTVFVFFGDHLPYFDAAFECYERIGYSVLSNSLTSIQNRYKVPYFIWANDAARNQAENKGFEIITGQGEEISSNFLASQMFECIGIDAKPFFSFVSEIKKEIKVVSPTYHVVKDEIMTELPDELVTLISDYKKLQYYNLKDYYKTGGRSND